VFIKRAKDEEIGAEVLLERLALLDTQAPGPAGLPALPLARMGAEIYNSYQRSLSYRGMVDFDDLIRLALQALRLDAEYLARLQYRWPYVLEDEAQDSSELQEKILRLLAGEQGNWVRVGDPNQAIYETFTNANPEFLRNYLKERGVTRVRLAQSGRSQQAIIELANYLVDWTYNEHPRGTDIDAFERQHIQPTGPGDPQPNPPANPAAVRLVDRDLTPEAELQFVAKSLARWLDAQMERPERERDTCAVLAPRNQRGFELIDRLKQQDIPYVDLLRSTSSTRQTAGVLGNLLRCLADPTSARRLSVAFQVWRRHDRGDPEAEPLMKSASERIAGCPAVEAYLWPRADHDWLAHVSPALRAVEDRLLVGFRDVARRWHRAADLPIDQLILTLSSDLFQEPTELALAHKLAVLLRLQAQAHPTYRLAELVEELAVIARNERRFLGFADEDTGFKPPPGQVTITTMHKAKGLEWDRVYLMSVNNYDFPSGMAHDTYISERWFVRDRLNLEAEALAQLATVQAAAPDAGGEAGDWRLYTEQEATREARLGYVAERLRLLYVGITRAKRDLIVTWNTGRRRGDKLQPAVPFVALHDHWRASVEGGQGDD
jgi:DNA helicase-2/ATP-dependent DNA helicase PcrA